MQQRVPAALLRLKHSQLKEAEHVAAVRVASSDRQHAALAAVRRLAVAGAQCRWGVGFA